MTVIVYGIPTCDTVRKARGWLDRHGVVHRFHDFRADGLESRRLDGWLHRLGWEALLNRSSATFRALDEADRSGLGPEKAARLMLANPTMIKRPVLERDEDLLVGFRPERYEALFGSAG
ncbi:MAG: arsenate reductase [Mesorhizobium sp.]